MAIKLKNGIVLRNPAEKAKRYARQMKNGCVTETGQKLSATDLAFRAGYLQARRDSANAFNSNKKKKRVVRTTKRKTTMSRQKTKKRYR